MKSKNLLIVGLFTGMALSGCYTVIEHPDVTTKDENGYTMSNEVMFYDDCSNCHQDTAEHSYTANDGIDPQRSHRPYNTYNDGYYYDSGSYYYDDYGYSGTNMGYFYNSPWWYQFRPQQSSPTVESGTKNRSGNSSSGIRNRDGGRGESQNRPDSRNADRPTVFVPSGSSGSSSSSSSSSTRNTSTTSSTSSSSSNNRTSETRSRNDNGSSERKSSDQSGTRNSDGGRSSGKSSGDSGRR